MNKFKKRIKNYSCVATNLDCLSNNHLEQRLLDGKRMHKGIGGNSLLITIENIPVFVKKIPITDIERLPQHCRSTANLFNLPLFYQYGVGSTGFGVWRELAAHIMTTNWVLSESCMNFPVLYHWRILPKSPSDLAIDYWENIDRYCEYWENAPAIRKRVEDINGASFQLVLFLEFVPHNLYTWLSRQISQNDKPFFHAINVINESLKLTNDFMSKNGLVHFDAHFENILTDGDTLFFSDFGLALSSKFDLTAAEKAFLKSHKNYDKACGAVNLLHCIITSIFGKESWELKLRKIINGEITTLPSELIKIIKSYGPVALAMDDFFQKLQKKSKSTPYPEDLIKSLLEQN